MKPIIDYPYSQTQELNKYNIEHGVCYGMCRNLLEKFSSRFMMYESNVLTAAGYIQDEIKTKHFIRHSYQKQLKRRQNNRSYISFRDIKPCRIYLVGIRLGNTYGYMTQYSIASYFVRHAYHANHEILIYLDNDSRLLLFEPNLGYIAFEEVDLNSIKEDLKESIDIFYEKRNMNNPNIYICDIEK